MLKKIFYLLICITLFCISGCAPGMSHTDHTTELSSDNGTITITVPEGLKYIGKLRMHIHGVPLRSNVFSVPAGTSVASVGIFGDGDMYLPPQLGGNGTVAMGDCHHNEYRVECITKFDKKKCLMSRYVKFPYTDEWSIYLVYSHDFRDSEYPCKDWTYSNMNMDQKKILKEWNREADNVFTIKRTPPETE